jgi:hypothetical protein
VFFKIEQSQDPMKSSGVIPIWNDLSRLRMSILFIEEKWLTFKNKL